MQLADHKGNTLIGLAVCVLCNVDVHSLFSASVDPTRRHMLLQIVGGRAFLEHLSNDDVHSSLTVHIHFRGQRFQSQPTPCACEPNFNEAFVLEIHKETSGALHHNTC